MQNLLNIKFNISSVVVAPVISSRGRSAAYKSSNNISCGIFSATAPSAFSSAPNESLTSA